MCMDVVRNKTSAASSSLNKYLSMVNMLGRAGPSKKVKKKSGLMKDLIL
jgi:hypothetical protein